MASPRPALPDPESDRRAVGALHYVLFMFAGASGLLLLFVLAPLASRDPIRQYQSMGIGAVCALPPLAIYLWLPRLIDRFDPERWWALALVLGWGAIAACGIAAVVNTASKRSPALWAERSSPRWSAAACPRRSSRRE